MKDIIEKDFIGFLGNQVKSSWPLLYLRAFFLAQFVKLQAPCEMVKMLIQRQ